MNARRGALAAVCLALLLAGAASLRLFRCTAPWDLGHLGYNGAVYSAIAHIHLTRGFPATRFLNAREVQPGGGYRFYLNHPPLLGVLVACSFRLFGESECAARLVPVSFSLGCLVVLYLLAAPLWGRRTALLSVFFGAFMPMDAFYGPQVEVFGSTVLFFILSSYALYRRWRRTGLRRDLWTSALAFLLALCTEWTGYYLLVLVLAEEAAGGGRAEMRRGFRVYLGVGAAAFALHLGVVRAVTGSFGGGGWVGSLLFRMNLGPRAKLFPFTAPQYLRMVSSYMATYFGRTVIALSVLGLLDALCPPSDGRGVGRRTVALNLLALGLMHPVFFRNAVWIHDYTLFNLTPAAAILSAAGAARIWKTISRRSPVVAGTALGSLLVLHAAWGLAALARLHAASGFPECRRLGEFLRARTAAGDTVLTALPATPVYAYYSGREVLGDIRTTDEFRAAASRGAPAWYAGRYAPRGEGERRLDDLLAGRYRRIAAAPYRLYDLRGATGDTGPCPGASRTAERTGPAVQRPTAPFSARFSRDGVSDTR